jgi:hypothetical protein
VEKSYPDLSPAFKLGQYIEAHTAQARKRSAAVRVQNDFGLTIEDELRRPTKDEVALTHGDITDVVHALSKYLSEDLHGNLLALHNMASNGMLGTDEKQEKLLFSSIAGSFEENMNRGAVWNVIQIGRLSTRSISLIEPVIQVISHSKIPSTEYLMYIYHRNQCMIPNIHEGTHLWIAHQLFNYLLKVEKNPRSLSSIYLKCSLFVESLPVPEELKPMHENISNAQNRLGNDLSFLDVHEMLGDDPDDHFSNIAAFFDRQLYELKSLAGGLEEYFVALTAYINDLPEDAFFELEA